MKRSTQVRFGQSPEEVREQKSLRIGVNEAFQAEGTARAEALRLLP